MERDTMRVETICHYRVPEFNQYWSNYDPLGNAAIKKAISRDHFELLLPKIYLNNSVKPRGAGKIL